MFRDTKSPDGKDLRKRLEEGQKRLSDCKSGEKVKIVSIDAGKGSKLNLMNLGLSIGSSIAVKRPSRVRGPVAVEFNDTEIAVGYGLAEKIIVFSDSS
jgi:ferrous iron transport protein A